MYRVDFFRASIHRQIIVNPSSNSLLKFLFNPSSKVLLIPCLWVHTLLPARRHICESAM
jgi:hypothetical protein